MSRPQYHKILTVTGNKKDPHALKLDIIDPRHPRYDELKGKDQISTHVNWQNDISISAPDAQRVLLEPTDQVEQCYFDVLDKSKDPARFHLEKIVVSAAWVHIRLQGLETLLEESNTAANPHSFRYIGPRGRTLHIELDHEAVLVLQVYGNPHMPFLMEHLHVVMGGKSKLQFRGEGNAICRSLTLNVGASCVLDSLAVAESARFYCETDNLAESVFQGCSLGLHAVVSGPAARVGMPSTLTRQDWVNRTFHKCMKAMNARPPPDFTTPPPTTHDNPIDSWISSIFVSRPALEEQEEDDTVPVPAVGQILPPGVFHGNGDVDDGHPNDESQLDEADYQAQLADEHNRGVMQEQQERLAARAEGAKVVRKRLLEEQEKKTELKCARNEPPATECAVCMEKLANRGVFSPCGHAKACYPCSRTTWIENNAKCPICGQTALTVSELFL
jgi:hypothetical protein